MRWWAEVADFLMPSLGADMDEGTVLEWRVKPGDQVRKGDIVAVVDTDKAAIEVESFSSGTVRELLVQPGSRVPVGTVLATIGPREAQAAAGRAGVSSPLVRHLADERGVDLAAVRGTGADGQVTRADVTRAAGERPAPRPAAAPAPVAPAPAAPAPAAAGASGPVRPRVSPLARRLAGELSVDLTAVRGTGRGGVIQADDVRRAAAPPGGVPVPAQGTGQPAAKPAAGQAARATAGRTGAGRAQAARRATARLMARSKREIPHYYLANTIDLTAAMTWLRERNRALAMTDRLVPAALLMKAAAVAATRVPGMNGFWTEDEYHPADQVHLGVAISLRGGGLITPAIRGAAGLTPDDLMRGLRDLVARARSGRLRAAELTDATITVTNLGDQGVETVYGVIYPPQVALVGFGKVAERPVAAGGMVGVRPVVVSTLAADHRASDGYAGARYLAAVADLLQRPEEL